jgi:hypothetical protein
MSSKVSALMQLPSTDYPLHCSFPGIEQQRRQNADFVEKLNQMVELLSAIQCRIVMMVCSIKVAVSQCTD